MASLFGTSVEPSRLCFGTVDFGTRISRDDCFAVLDAFVEAGGTFLDTAHIYASWLEGGAGMSERTVGEWIRASGARAGIVLATKGGHPPLDEMARGRCDRESLEHDLTESLERLGVECIDLYWLHRDDPDRPVGEIVENLAAFVRDGRIRSCGTSNWTIPRVEAANAYAAERGLAPFVIRQPGWALAGKPTDMSSPSPMRYLDEPGRRWHVETQMPLAAYTAGAHGFFGAANVAWAEHGFEGPAPADHGYDTPENRARLQRAATLARDKGCTAHQIALAYLVNQPFPVFAIMGTSKPPRVREAMAATEIVLTEAECTWLREGEAER